MESEEKMNQTLDGDIEQELIQRIKDMMEANRQNNRKRSIEIAQELKQLMDAHIDCMKILDQENIPYEPIEYTGEKLNGTNLKIFRIKENNK